jgi:hypothetical protein
VPTQEIEIHEGELAGPFESLGPVKVRAGAQPTPFNKRPTAEDINPKLRKAAEKLGATAVIRAEYKPGIIPSSWRGLTATGEAVRLQSDAAPSTS